LIYSSNKSCTCRFVVKYFGGDWYSADKQTTNKNTVYIGQLFIFIKQMSNFNLWFFLLTKFVSVALLLNILVMTVRTGRAVGHAKITTRSKRSLWPALRLKLPTVAERWGWFSGRLCFPGDWDHSSNHLDLPIYPSAGAWPGFGHPRTQVSSNQIANIQVCSIISP
jgi:hypothetical protein